MYLPVCVCACACVSVRACVRMCVRVPLMICQAINLKVFNLTQYIVPININFAKIYFVVRYDGFCLTTWLNILFSCWIVELTINFHFTQRHHFFISVSVDQNEQVPPSGIICALHHLSSRWEVSVVDEANSVRRSLRTSSCGGKCVCQTDREVV